MRPREKRLLAALLGLAGLGGLVVGSNLYVTKRDALRDDAMLLESEWITIRTLFEEKETWEMRANWLERNQPAYTTSEEIDREIFDLAAAEGVPGLVRERPALLPTVTTRDYVQAGVSLTARGELADLMRWLHQLARPESFRVIKDLVITPDEDDPSKVAARIELLRWYAPPSP